RDACDTAVAAQILRLAPCRVLKSSAMTYRYVLSKFSDAEYATSMRAATLYFFNLTLLLSMPLFALIYLIWLPHRLHVALPPMAAIWCAALFGQVLLRTGRLFAAGHLLALAMVAILVVAQAKKVYGEY